MRHSIHIAVGAMLALASAATRAADTPPTQAAIRYKNYTLCTAYLQRILHGSEPYGGIEHTELEKAMFAVRTKAMRGSVAVQKQFSQVPLDIQDMDMKLDWMIATQLEQELPAYQDKLRSHCMNVAAGNAGAEDDNSIKISR